MLKKTLCAVLILLVFAVPVLSMMQSEEILARTNHDASVFAESEAMGYLNEAMIIEDGQPLQAAVLSLREMKETEGAVWPIIIRVGSTLIVKYGPQIYKIAVHGAHHTFRWIGKQPHLQLNGWIEGLDKSGKTILRIPLKFWK